MFVLKIKELWRMLVDRWKISCFVIFLVFVIAIVFLMKADGLPEDLFVVKFKYLLMLGIIVFGLVLSVLCICAFEKKWRLEKIFIAFVIPVGLIMMAVFPVGRVPDEVFHFARAYGVAHGSLVSDLTESGAGGSYYSADVLAAVHWEKDLNYGMYRDNFAIFAYGDNEEVFNVYTNTSQYPFLAYLPQAIGIKIGEIFKLPVLGLALFGRLFNFLFWVLLMYYAIKLIPFKKMSVLLVMFMPMMLQESISLSVDPIINGTTFLLFSYCLNMRYSRKDFVNNKDRIILAVLCLIVSLCKMVYLPVCLTLFLIPEHMFKTKKRKYLEIGLLAFLVVALVGIWTVVAMRYQLRPGDGVSAIEQIGFVLESPLRTIKVLIRTIAENAYVYMENLVCGPMGWFDIPIDSICTMVMLCMLVMVCIMDNAGKKINNSEKTCMSVILLSTLALIFAAEYLTWTPVGSMEISGVQGRYFIPLLIPAFVIFNNRIKYDLSRIYKYMFLTVVFVDIYAIITVFYAHVI